MEIYILILNLKRQLFCCDALLEGKKDIQIEMYLYAQNLLWAHLKFPAKVQKAELGNKAKSDLRHPNKMVFLAHSHGLPWASLAENRFNTNI